MSSRRTQKKDAATTMGSHEGRRARRPTSHGEQTDGSRLLASSSLESLNLNSPPSRRKSRLALAMFSSSFITAVVEETATLTSTRRVILMGRKCRNTRRRRRASRRRPGEDDCSGRFPLIPNDVLTLNEMAPVSLGASRGVMSLW
ncbi:hypothetical protein BDZ89DRAFT_220513 [Hymenopellis radicata]|nr:hypothetical protein BDZ89DRAFT_220513 [Hymenopellis radicata]